MPELLVVDVEGPPGEGEAHARAPGGHGGRVPRLPAAQLAAAVGGGGVARGRRGRLVPGLGARVQDLGFRRWWSRIEE